MKWGRAILGGLLAEILVLVLILPVALAVGYDLSAGDPSSVPPALNAAIVIGSFIGPLVTTQWVAKRVASQFVLHGFLVGFTAFVIYMIPITLSGGTQPPIYWVAHAMKILGGLTGGFVAARRHAAPRPHVAT
jgi:putative membrane protein (TIGR04086 family)